jgi:dipeptidyl-peptidase 4
MSNSYPRQFARTRRFSLGAPKSFQVSPDGGTVFFLRSQSGTDPVTCLWALDVATGTERLVVDPGALGMAEAQEDDVEKARRERARESAGGIVGFATDSNCTVAAFTLAGALYVVDLGGSAGQPRLLPTAAAARDPRPDPTGKLVGYVSDDALRVIDLGSGDDRVIADPAGAQNVSFGLAEFIAAEEMDRTRGYWWAPDGSALLVARVDESPVQVWYISDPANPATPPRAVRYPQAGTGNAEVTLWLASLTGELTPVQWDNAALEYLVTASWQPADETGPLIVVQSRDQRDMRIMQVDRQTGGCTLVRRDTDPRWVDIVPGVPSRTADGRIAWTADSDGTKRLYIATAQQHADGSAAPVTPVGLNVRQVLAVDGNAVLFSASDEDPTQVDVWLADGTGLIKVNQAEGVHSADRAGGTTVLTSHTLATSGVTVSVLRHESASDAGQLSQVAAISSLAEQPNLPGTRLDLYRGGSKRLCTAILLPSWHKPGSAKLPVLCDPYGGPHLQRVLAAQAGFHTSQWFAEQGFAVVVADGRGTPGRGPEWDRLVFGDLVGPAVEDQVEALQAAAERCADLDLSTVAIRGWSFGGELSALAVLRRPDVFHAAIIGAPVTDQALYDTHYTERYLGKPNENPEGYARSAVLAEASKLSRPVMIIHGLADDNVAVANSLRLSSALLAAGRPHTVLPLSGVTHMATQEDVAENLLLLQIDFLRSALGIAAPAAQ